MKLNFTDLICEISLCEIMKTIIRNGLQAKLENDPIS